jgi:riboflavin kinase / FMN adenylyltransferase
MDFAIWGKVKKGKSRGKLLGFPTANFPLHRNISQGIYISKSTISKKIYHSVTFIGNAKTYGEKDLKVETHILNFNLNIYGKYLSVRLFKKIRENIKFENEKMLIDQIKKDIAKTKLYFNL